MKALLLTAWFLVTAATVVHSADDDGFVPLFNGRDLSGWVNANCAPETWSVRDGMIHCTGLPTGAMRTTRQYENFILELEWRHLNKAGNSGVFLWGTPIAAPGVPFLRGIEAQVLDHGYAEQFEKQNGKKSESFTTHGDVFPIHGATMKPFGPHRGDRSFPTEERSKGSPEWNHYRIVCTNGVIRLNVNGREVSGGENCNYRKGYLALESEGAPVQFRNLRIKELPTSHPAAELIAPVDSGLRTVFNGLDLRGWKTNDAVAQRWQVRGERLHLRAGAADAKATLWSAKEYGDAEFVFDCRPAKPTEGKDLTPLQVMVRGQVLSFRDVSPGKYQRFHVTVQGSEIVVTSAGKESQRLRLPGDAPRRSAFGLIDHGDSMELMNLYAREL